VDARTDIYALGGMLYSCLTGQAPYARETEVAVLQAHLLEPPPKVRDQRPDLPMALDRVVAKAMAKAKDDRYSSCGDLIAAAESAIRERPDTGRMVAGGTILASTQTGPDTAPGPSETVLAGAGATGAAAGAPPTEAGAQPPTEASPVPPPPPAPPPATKEPSGGGKSRGKLIAGALAAAAVVLAVVLIVVLLTRDDNSSSTPTGNGTTFNVALSSSSEVPASVSTSSSGRASVTIDGKKVCWAFTLRGVDNPNAAHIHNGSANVSGPVVVPLGGKYARSGCTTAPTSVTNAILASPTTYYVNVHSQKYPDGAVRGQLAGSGSQQGPTGQGSLHAVGLSGIVPAGIFKGCTVQPTPNAGAAQTAECTPPAGQTSFYPDKIELSTYTSTPALLKAYNDARSAAGVGKDFGRCDRTSWGGEGAWVHPGVPAKPGGRRFCYFDGNNAVMVWAHEKLGQPTHVDFLGVAREGGTDHSRLYSWWNFWIHLMGKCLQEGCTASAK
jgi:hypothetical protein